MGRGSQGYDMTAAYQLYWGKARSGGDRTEASHPLVYHCLDVATDGSP